MSKEITPVPSTENGGNRWLDLSDRLAFEAADNVNARLMLLEKYGRKEAAIKILDEGEPVDFHPRDKALSDLAAACQNFLAVPTYSDGFVSHAQRRVWRAFLLSELGEKYRWAADQNRLRQNHFLAITWNVDPLMFGISRSRVCLPKRTGSAVSRFARDIEEHRNALAHYDDLTLGYKLRVIRSTADACRRVAEKILL